MTFFSECFKIYPNFLRNEYNLTIAIWFSYEKVFSFDAFPYDLFQYLDKVFSISLSVS